MNEQNQQIDDEENIAEQEKQPTIRPSTRKTYIVSVATEDLLLIRAVIVAMDVFDALRKCSMRLKDEECDIDCVTVQIEETEVIQ